MMRMTGARNVFDSLSEDVYLVRTHAAGPAGSLPLTDEQLRTSPSGDLFGLSQNAGMGDSEEEWIDDAWPNESFDFFLKGGRIHRDQPSIAVSINIRNTIAVDERVVTAL